MDGDYSLVASKRVDYYSLGLQPSWFIRLTCVAHDTSGTDDIQRVEGAEGEMGTKKWRMAQSSMTAAMGLKNFVTSQLPKSTNFILTLRLLGPQYSTSDSVLLKLNENIHIHW